MVSQMDNVLDLFKKTQTDQLTQFTAGLASVVDEPERPDPVTPATPPINLEPVFYDHLVMKTQGKFAGGYPEGLIVHFTDGAFNRGLQSAIDTVDYGKAQDYAYWCMAQDGTIVRGHALTDWGYHAGVSTYPSIGKSVSRVTLGLEIACAGRLTKKDDGTFVTDWGLVIPTAEVNHVETARYPQETPGYYHAYTTQQQSALVNFVMWLLKNSPKGVFSLDKVLGHDEVATPVGRKDDPGGSLFLGMPQFRDALKAEAKARGLA